MLGRRAWFLSSDVFAGLIVRYRRPSQPGAQVLPPLLPRRLLVCVLSTADDAVALETHVHHVTGPSSALSSTHWLCRCCVSDLSLFLFCHLLRPSLTNAHAGPRRLSRANNERKSRSVVRPSAEANRPRSVRHTERLTPFSFSLFFSLCTTRSARPAPQNTVSTRPFSLREPAATPSACAAGRARS